MTQITVSADIALAISQSSLPIVLVDPQGRKLGQMTKIDSSPSTPNGDEDEWAETKRRIEQAKREGGTFYTTQQVLAHLKSLESK
jgi:hypothetical protein